MQIWCYFKAICPRKYETVTVLTTSDYDVILSPVCFSPGSQQCASVPFSGGNIVLHVWRRHVSWRSFVSRVEPDQVDKFLPYYQRKKLMKLQRPPPAVFEMTPCTGMLSPAERINVQIKFSPAEGVKWTTLARREKEVGSFSNHNKSIILSISEYTKNAQKLSKATFIWPSL